MIKFEEVRKIGLRLPDVEEGKTYGSPALKVKGKLLACLAVHKSAEPNSLAVRISFEEREKLMAADSDVYYLTEHYVNYPCVLVRLSKIKLDELESLLNKSWKFVNSKSQKSKKVK